MSVASGTSRERWRRITATLEDELLPPLRRVLPPMLLISFWLACAPALWGLLTQIAAQQVSA